MRPRDPLTHSLPVIPEGRTRVTVNLDTFVRNVRTVQRRLGPGEDLLPVIKSNAYGHGLLPVMQALSSEGLTRIAVMGSEEARSLRDGGFSGTIVLLGGFTAQELSLCIQERFTPVLHNWEHIRILEDRSLPGPDLDLHLKVDTGMGRLGFLPEEIQPLLVRLAGLPRVKIRGLMTHFPESEDRNDTETCMKILKEVLLAHRDHPAFSDLEVVHMANSGAVMQGLVSFPEPISGGRPIVFWARPGLMLYGYLPETGVSGWEPIRPVLSVEARLISVRTLPDGHSVSYGRTRILSRRSRIGVLGIGYADGLPRSLSGRGWGMIDGRKVPFLGRVCMDMVVVDLTDLPRDVGIGEWVRILDPEDPQAMTVDQIARWTDSIPYEVLCLLGHRADRRYIGGNLRISPP